MRGNDLEWRNWRRHRSACVDQPPSMAARHQRGAGNVTGAQHTRLGFVAGSSQRTSVQRRLPSIRLARLLRFRIRSLGDMACHILGAANMALMLGSPTSVECVKAEDRSQLYFPAQSVVRFDFPARNNMPAVKVFWYDAMRSDQPTFAGAPQGEILGDLPRTRTGSAESATVEPKERQIIGGVFTDKFFHPSPKPAQTMARKAPEKPLSPREAKEAHWMQLINTGTNGSLFVGSKGMITTGTYGEWTRLLPVEKMRDYEFPPEVLPRSPGHYRDWIRSCKGGVPACSNFSVSAPFTEWIALGSIAIRTNSKLDWDSENLQITNNNDANQLLKPFVRDGWKIA